MSTVALSCYLLNARSELIILQFMCIVLTLKVMPHSLIDSRSFSVCFVSSLLLKLASAVAAAVTMFLISTSLMRSSK